MADQAAQTWRDRLEKYNGSNELFDAAFLAQWGGETWFPQPADKIAAAALHTQIMSRITVQRLGYSDGVEATALDSVYKLFEKARDIVDRNFGCKHFEAIAWHVLNTHVRPFTAKWHWRSQAGELGAVDATDEFRAELGSLQKKLRDFDRLLVEMRDGEPPPPAPDATLASAILNDLNGPLRWGVRPVGALTPGQAWRINRAERACIKRRQQADEEAGTRGYATGLALSGGGIRSATFSLGVLAALAKRDVLKHIDYLSTVSGGGYLGAFLTTFLAAGGRAGKIGLKPQQLPFLREGGESAALRHIRHNSRYLLTGSLGERFSMILSMFVGMALNAAAVLALVALVASVEFLGRGLLPSWTMVSAIPSWLALPAALAVLWGILRLRAGDGWLRWLALAILYVAGGALGVLLFGRSMAALRDVYTADGVGPAVLTITAIATIAAPVILAASGRRSGWPRIVLAILASVSAPLFLIACELGFYQLLGSPVSGWWHGLIGLALSVLILCLVWFVDVNVTSLHRHYRDKLAGAFLIQPAASPTGEQPFDAAVPVKLTSIEPGFNGPYPLFNAALNVPGSRNSAMQGRLTDFFLFSPAFCGSPITGYIPTRRWEEANPKLTLATVMAISGAAVSSQMGLATSSYLRFWLALLNVRLGYWLGKPPAEGQASPVRRPGLLCLSQEMTGSMHENGDHLYVSDGGHIENLGVYELLRRRCKCIIAVDGEQDPLMTFHGLANLQRMAKIDFDIDIEIDLNDLRLNTKGVSRSHFVFCRIRYPKDALQQEDATGYLLYLKLSLTGNEGEFLRRYKLDEPDFPHHSTADQFFTEAQFEAYRSLGEHVGEKLFLPAIIGEVAQDEHVDFVRWFAAIGDSLLPPDT
ncbi:patatin-like phospholipase family protein [Azospirillum sp. TSO22-1]|uniref:patatin-like phospholipase family protein n=1 Tax=Azospirillum sp. TSO22-1 TaxID=716789 RepID=UPI000D62104C|nr:patatin-like phospholipase family protein [Azospirillum sp. TSO22-1]PWC40167.1 hypothetical protein TSO221_25665 [Azospirillum sp. TSO22-1]